MADCCFDLPQVPVCAISDCRDDVSPVTFCVTSDSSDDLPPVPASPWAISDCSVVEPTSQLKQQEINEIISKLTDSDITQYRQTFVEILYLSLLMSTLLIFLLTDVGSSSYEIVRKLGEGGFGSVYAGIRLKDGLEVSFILLALSIKLLLHSYTRMTLLFKHFQCVLCSLLEHLTSQTCLNC